MLMDIVSTLLKRLFNKATPEKPVDYVLVANTKELVDDFIQAMVIKNGYSVVCSFEDNPKIYTYHDKDNNIKGCLVRTPLHDYGYLAHYK